MDDEVLARREEAPPSGQAGAKAALHRVRQGVVLAADLAVEFDDVPAGAVGQLVWLHPAADVVSTLTLSICQENS